MKSELLRTVALRVTLSGQITSARERVLLKRDGRFIKIMVILHKEADTQTLTKTLSVLLPFDVKLPLPHNDIS